MTPTELHNIMIRLGLSQAGAAELLRVNVRTMRRWMDGVVPVPFVVGFVLFLLDEGIITETDLRANP